MGPEPKALAVALSPPKVVTANPRRAARNMAMEFISIPFKIYR